MNETRLEIEIPLRINWWTKTKKGVTTLSLEDNGNKMNTFILNQNKYRNAATIVLSHAKKAYHMWIEKHILDDLTKGMFCGKVFRCKFDYWHPTKRAVDVSNPISIIEKFVFDGLQECGIIEDDNCNNLIGHDGWDFHGCDRENYPEGRCILTIYEV